MDEVLNKLKKYFEEILREEILKGWQDIKKNVLKSNIKLNDFLNQKCRYDMCKDCNGIGRKENG